MTIITGRNTGVTLSPPETGVTLTGDFSGFGHYIPLVFTFSTGGASAHPVHGNYKTLKISGQLTSQLCVDAQLAVILT